MVQARPVADAELKAKLHRAKSRNGRLLVEMETWRDDSYIIGSHFLGRA